MSSYGITFLSCIMEVTQLVKEMKLTYNSTFSSSTNNLRNVYFRLRIAPASFTYVERVCTTQYTQNSTKLAYKNGSCRWAVDASDTAQRLRQRGQLRCSHDYVRRCSKCVTLPLSAARLQISTYHKIGFVVVPIRRSDSLFCFHSQLQISQPL